MCSTANTPTQLMQLGQTKLFGIFNQHHRRIGNINTHLEHAGADGSRRGLQEVIIEAANAARPPLPSGSLALPAPSKLITTSTTGTVILNYYAIANYPFAAVNAFMLMVAMMIGVVVILRVVDIRKEL